MFLSQMTDLLEVFWNILKSHQVLIMSACVHMNVMKAQEEHTKSPNIHKLILCFTQFCVKRILKRLLYRL